jgi:Fe-S-cluster containining protein
MLLSKPDIKRLERAGYKARDFVRLDKQGLTQLRNVKGYCFFYEPDNRCCKVYGIRPLGCRIYPVIYSLEEGVVVDYDCPRWETVSEGEVEVLSSKLLRLLRRVDAEAKRPERI